MADKPRKQIEDIIGELRSWLPNYDHGPNDYPILLFRILASMPGGDELEDMGYETFNLGWHEMDQLARVLDAIQDKTDVEDLVHGLLYEEEEDEGVGEARGRRTREAARPVQVHAALIEALAADVNALRSERRITFEQAYDTIIKPDWVRQYEADGGDMANLGNRVINKAKSLARGRSRETPPRRPAPKTRAKKAPAKKTQRRAPRTRRRRR